MESIPCAFPGIPQDFRWHSLWW